MIISSRTPEGSPGRCPICGCSVRIEPSLLFGDAPCPSCGQLLWFLALRSDTRFFEAEKGHTIRERLLDWLAENLNVNRDALRSDTSLLKKSDVDSLDLVELMLELDV